MYRRLKVTAFMFLPVTGKPAARIYQCCHLKDRRAYPGHLEGTVTRETKTEKNNTRI